LYDQISELVDEVGLVMTGLTPSARFVTNVARRTKIDMGKAMLIAQDINKEVFDKMRQSLQKIEAEHEENWSEESGNVAPEKPQPGPSERTMTTDAEKEQKNSVISAVEKAGGFVIDKPADAQFQAETAHDDTLVEKTESKKDIINMLEMDSSLPPDHLLGDTPEKSSPVAPLEPDHSSIVDALLSKGVAMSMDSDTKKPGEPEKKVRPYDGTDPYRESIK